MYGPGGFSPITPKPEASPIQESVERDFWRKLACINISSDAFVWLVYLPVWTFHVLCAFSLNFYENSDAWSWTFFRLFLPTIIAAAILVGYLTIVQYKVGGLLIVYLFLFGILWLFLVLLTFWTGIADLGNCGSTLWCTRLQYWTVDPLTFAVVFGPSAGPGPIWSYIGYFVSQIALVLLGGGLLVLSIIVFATLRYRNAAITSAKTF